MRRKPTAPGDRFEINGRWLGRVDGSESWYAFWYDPERRKTRRKTLDEPDFERAKLALARHVMEATAPVRVDPAAVSLGEILARYLIKTDRQPSGPGYRSAATYIAEFFPDALVSDLTMGRQREFVDWLGGKDFSPGYIKRIIGIISGALGYAVENDMITYRPPVLMALGKIAERLDKPHHRGTRRLTVEELATLIDAIDAPHMLRYTMLALNTLARPAAILEMRWNQIEDDIISLNPPGRRQTKKRRPTIRVTETLSAWLAAWLRDKDLIVHFHGRQVSDPRLGLQNIAIRTGLMTEDDVGTARSIHPYTFRRSMARILRGRGVSMEDLGAWMGHRIPDAATTEVFYADADPRYLAGVRDAIDGVMADIGALLKTTPIRPAPVETTAYRFGAKRLFGSI